ncbi:hypothetical protein ACFQRB_03205 [Halobaculum litoreum]|uniref:Uncharacterized protein n=1 Tax=Halobaculum litoreum TaxID=3031998 RepID=A0ABD5XQT7_9EURY
MLRAAGHDGYADTIRDRLLPAGAVEDRWTYEPSRSSGGGWSTNSTPSRRRSATTSRAGWTT